MNKLLKTLGGIFLFLLVGGAISLAVLYFKSLPLEKSATSYFNENVPFIVKSWDAGALTKRATPELMEQASKEQLQDMFSWLSNLGKLKKVEVPTVGITTGVYPNTPYNGIWATCESDAEFEAGSAKIRVVLKRSGESWLVMGFHINSPALIGTPMPNPSFKRDS